jgi:hypothetical protein
MGSAGPRPDGTEPAVTAVPVYGAVIAPVDDEMGGEDDENGAGGAGGMSNEDAGAVDAGISTGGAENEPPQIQPLYGAPAFSEE